MAGNAQSRANVRRELRADTGTLYFRFSPLGVIDPFDGNITFGGEYRFNDTWAATLDAGAILYSAYLSNMKNATGFMVRPGIRLYPTTYKDFFLDLQVHYKNVTYQVKDWLEKDVVANVSTYEEYKVFRFNKQVIGGHIMAGFRDYFTNNRRFYIEWYLGVGIHHKNESIRNEPNSRYNRGMRLDNNRDGKYLVPALPAGVRLVYLFR
jgi:hypothetical protein